MKTFRKPSQFNRALAAALVFLLGMGPVATPTFAALTQLADEPLNVKNSSKPNIVFTVDDSGSMLFDFLPDYVIGLYCRDGTGSKNSLCGSPGFYNDYSAFSKGKDVTPGYIFQQYNYPFSAFSTQDASTTPIVYDAAGPGSGCDTSPRCSAGVDVGTSPGIASYPDSAVWADQTNPSINGGTPYKAYAYWKLWPAPVHNNALNHLYYNPMLTYLPPVHDDGSSFDSMDESHTSTWTKVPVDPWASTVVYADLTANVTVGQWCNSDWSVGHESDPAYCRTNGVGPSASDSATASGDGDYLYPLIPPGPLPSDLSQLTINPFKNLDAQTIGQSIAYSKVTAGTSIGSSAVPVNAAVWSLSDSTGFAKDDQYYYENDNVIWCNRSADNWPATNGQTQTCDASPTQNQTCSGTKSTPKCGGGAQTCTGGTAQTCKSTTQTCQNQTTVQSCQTAASQTCQSVTGQTCNGYNTFTCQNKAAQTCDGYQTQTCGLSSQTCKNVVNQTCNVKSVCRDSGGTCSTSNDCPPIAGSCSTVFDPPNCNTCVGPECGTCTLKTVCANQPCVTSGKCSSSGVACVTDTNCTTIPGTCSLTKASCTSDAGCTAAGNCSLDTATVCTSDANCLAHNGACSKTGVACQPANAATQCPVTGNCSGGTGTTCTMDTNCPATNGKCTISKAACQPASQAAQCPPLGTCSSTGAQCKDDTACPNVGGTCNLTGKTCGTNADCKKAGICNLSGAVCASDLACPSLLRCSTTGATCTAATAATDCPKQNQHCSIDTATACTSNADCPTIAKTCDINSSNKGTTCTTNAQCTAIVIPGVCSVTRYTCNAATATTDCPSVVNSGVCHTSDGVAHGNTCSSASPSCPNYFLPDQSATCSTAMRVDTTHSLFYDADGSGFVCRHNNKAYAAASSPQRDGTTLNVPSATASRYNYPDATYNYPVVGGSGATACSVSPRYKSVPRHYWKTNVEWCAQGQGAGSWNGYGMRGSCQSFKDSSHSIPRFYQFGAGPDDDGYTNDPSPDHPAFTRVDLIPGNTYTHTFKSVDWTNASGPTVTGTDTVTRNYAEEMENYSNWFAYYRTRIQAVKTVTSLAFLGTDPTTSKFNVDDQFRVGLHTLSNNPDTTFVPVDDFKAAQKTAWATQLFGLAIRMDEQTPSLNAIARIGEYFGGTSNYKGSNPLSTAGTASDPIVLSCQKNWHMLFTDGLTYQPPAPLATWEPPVALTPDGDQDNTTPSGATWLASPTGLQPTGLTPGQPWPRPYQEDTSAPSQYSASDYATYYWVTDLRTSGDVATNNVGQSAADKAYWQHVNFAAISLGTEGMLPAGDQSSVEAQLSSSDPDGLKWPQPSPSVYAPDASGVDDLWHASVNSRGRFVNADNADEIKIGMGAILADIANTAGSRAGAGLQTVNITGGSANAYIVTFEPGWGGTLSKVAVDPSTLTIIGNAAWQVGGGKDVSSPNDSLYSQLTPTTTKPKPWYTNRNIVTMHTNGTPIPFLFDQLSDSQKDALAPGKPDRGLQVLEYLRGSAQNEGQATLNFRARVSPLGDVVDSSPRYVGPPNAPYTEINDPGYGDFASSHSSRKPMVYVAANDGMLHALDDGTGFERFAYIPRTIIRPVETSSGNPDPGIPALTLKEGALPPFKHHFYVDSTPKITDVDFGSQDWHTILVGGLGKGGHAYYALDVTTADGVLNESDAASRVLWEFTDSDLGYTYGAPLVTKTAGFSGKWVVIVPSGYNNASGVGKIWILDAKTGEVLKTLSTGFGSSTSPSGLAQIAGFTQDYHNYKTDEVYGGDQYGNVWRFDLRDPNPDNWTVGKFAYLTDPSGDPQPVTTAPQIEIDIANGADRWVFFGTGRLLDESDLDDAQIQSFYAIRDGTQKVPSAIVSGSPIIRSDLISVTSATGTGGITAHGWVDDLPQFSSIVTPFQAVLSIVVYSATKPQTDPCLTGQQADVYVRSFAQGVSQIDDTSATGTGITCSAEYCQSDSGAVDAQIIGTTSDGSPTANLAVSITLGVTGQLAKIPIKQPTWSYTNRLSWRILSE